jgi:hypothetical protein
MIIAPFSGSPVANVGRADSCSLMWPGRPAGRFDAGRRLARVPNVDRAFEWLPWQPPADTIVAHPNLGAWWCDPWVGL